MPAPSASSRALWSNANSKLSTSLRSSRVRNDSTVEALAVVTEGREEAAAGAHGNAGDESGHLHTQCIQLEGDNALPVIDMPADSVFVQPAVAKWSQAARMAAGATPSRAGIMSDGAWAGEAAGALDSRSGGGDVPPVQQPLGGGEDALACVAELRAARRTTDCSAATLESNDLLLPCWPNMSRPADGPTSVPLLRASGTTAARASAPGAQQASELQSELANLSDLVRMVDNRVSALISEAQAARGSSTGGVAGAGAAQ